MPGASPKTSSVDREQHPEGTVQGPSGQSSSNARPNRHVGNASDGLSAQARPPVPANSLRLTSMPGGGLEGQSFGLASSDPGGKQSRLTSDGYDSDGSLDETTGHLLHASIAQETQLEDSEEIMEEAFAIRDIRHKGIKRRVMAMAAKRIGDLGVVDPGEEADEELRLEYRQRLAKSLVAVLKACDKSTSFQSIVRHIQKQPSEASTPIIPSLHASPSISEKNWGAEQPLRVSTVDGAETQSAALVKAPSVTQPQLQELPARYPSRSANAASTPYQVRFQQSLDPQNQHQSRVETPASISKNWRARTEFLKDNRPQNSNRPLECLPRLPRPSLLNQPLSSVSHADEQAPPVSITTRQGQTYRNGIPPSKLAQVLADNEDLSTNPYYDEGFRAIFTKKSGPRRSVASYGAMLPQATEPEPLQGFPHDRPAAGSKMHDREPTTYMESQLRSMDQGTLEHRELLVMRLQAAMDASLTHRLDPVRVPKSSSSNYVGKYDGTDPRFSTFESWLWKLCNHLQHHSLGGAAYDRHRINELPQFLDGVALEHFSYEVISPTRVVRIWTFSDCIICLFDRFVQRNTMEEARKAFDNVKYSHEIGVRIFHDRIKAAADLMLHRPSDFDIVNKFFQGLPRVYRHDIQFSYHLSPEIHSLETYLAKALQVEMDIREYERRKNGIKINLDQTRTESDGRTQVDEDESTGSYHSDSDSSTNEDENLDDDNLSNGTSRS